MAVDNEYRSPTIALDSGCPASDFSGEVQLLSEGFGLPVNKAIDLGAYGNTRYTVKTTLPADFNLDGAVNVGDLGILGANYGGMEKTWRTGDATGDGCVNVGDLGVLGANYGRSLE